MGSSGAEIVFIVGMMAVLESYLGCSGAEIVFLDDIMVIREDLFRLFWV